MEYKDYYLEESWQIEDSCEQLLAEISCDFVGLAFQSDGTDVRWHYAAGNSNEKYKKITVRYGKGIAGRVISTGRTMTIVNFPHQIVGKALDFPIMLAENLLSAFAVPIHFKGIPKGVLLVGRRINQSFSQFEQNMVLQAAKRLEKKLESNRGK